MPNKKQSFQLSALTIAVLGSSTSMLASAAEENTDDTEVIEVQGYRGSILKSINEKRNASTVVDSIFAEDIGKTTDQNIADALSRVTGVSINTEDGEGTSVTIRGAQSDFTNISLNGVTLTSSDTNNTVDLSTFSADILSQISVYKTSSADHDEGSLGANVVLRTAKPLSLKNDRMNVTYQGRYNDFADKYDHKLSGSFSKKFFDDTFGIIVTLADETQAIRRDEVRGNINDPYLLKTIPKRYTIIDGENGPEAQEIPVARDQNGELLYGGDPYFTLRNLNYSLGQNQRDRFTATTGFQWLPNDETNIQLDLSYSFQQVIRDDHNVGIQMPDMDTDPNLTVAGITDPAQINDPDWTPDILQYGPNNPILDNNGNTIYYPLVPDPQEDWWVFNTDNRTMIKALNRKTRGTINRQQQQDETKNKVATLRFDTWITDNLKVEAKLGYSSSNFDIVDNSSVSSATWFILHGNEIDDIPVDTLYPTGIDCTSGMCQMVVGDGELTQTPGGNQQGRAHTTFIPENPYAQHLGGVRLADGYTKDVNKSLFLDFDWDVDYLGVTKVEWGYKISQRDKDVYRNNANITDHSPTIFDPLTGKEVTSTNFSAYTTNEILDPDQSWEYGDDWLDGLVAKDPKYSLGFIENGWPLINARTAFQKAFALEKYELDNDATQSRQTIQDNYSFYGKLNFEYFDGRLTGDLGVRFVHTEIEAKKGKSAVVFRNDDRLFDPLKLVNNGLFDPSNPPCPSVRNNAAIQTMRIDGTGVVPDGTSVTDIRTGQVYGPGDSVPNQYPCYEREIGQQSPAETVDNPNYIPYNQASRDRSWWWNYRHGDITTALDPALFRREFDSAGTGESDIWLPSLNLNYQLTRDLIGRFAVSKTMSRPAFDWLRPGFRISENVWGLKQSNMDAPNPQLKPLQSKNLDLSIEWYFNKEGQLSLAYFRKDMTDFPLEVRDSFYWADIRDKTDLTELNIEDILIAKNDAYKPGVAIEDEGGYACMPDRYNTGQLASAMKIQCNEVIATFRVNGEDQKSEGIEFAYRQTYDFLPAPFDGLGADFNYTYAKTEQGPVFLELSGRTLPAAPQVNTPKHSANTSLYWQKKGHSMRLTHRYTGIKLNRRLAQADLWLDEKSQLDFAFNYKVNNQISISFNALNLTDEENRLFFTSREYDFGEKIQNEDGHYLDINGDVITVSNIVDTLPDGSTVTQTTPATMEQIEQSQALQDMLVPDVYNEGNPMDDSSVDKSRTVQNYKTGRQFRLGIRVNF
ncbi:TonB-dependent receptor [Gayadomonas joobiniege]|uniref:TonB-dependent receptor n=1 Tax=Gayadomonas joobiniege TaxID=1234606 RepID=UPI00036ABAE3|nr:TonB-dependent receptor [Gayadomonas joobiniege]